MAAQVFTFKITYADCDNRIWRTAAVSSNFTLAQLGYMVLATFDTMAYHLFEMKFKNTTYFLTEEDFEDLPEEENENYNLLSLYKIGNLNMNAGDKIEMTYDLGCNQVFDIELMEISEMPKGSERAYPKILDGAGRGIIDDMPASELLEIIRKIDSGERSGIHYSGDGYADGPEWNYRNYELEWGNRFLKGTIDRISDGHEELED